MFWFSQIGATNHYTYRTKVCKRKRHMCGKEYRKLRNQVESTTAFLLKSNAVFTALPILRKASLMPQICRFQSNPPLYTQMAQIVKYPCIACPAKPASRRSGAKWGQVQILLQEKTGWFLHQPRNCSYHLRILASKCSGCRTNLGLPFRD